jgi:protein subunit release factor B
VIDFGVSEAKVSQLMQRMSQLGLKEEEIEENFVRGSGPGGQKVNKTSSCVRLVHTPTGLEVKMQKTRSQGLNRFYARRRLCELLEARQLGDESPEARRLAKIRKQKDRRRRRSRGSSGPAEGGAQ